MYYTTLIDGVLHSIYVCFPTMRGSRGHGMARVINYYPIVVDILPKSGNMVDITWGVLRPLVTPRKHWYHCGQGPLCMI